MTIRYDDFHKERDYEETYKGLKQRIKRLYGIKAEKVFKICEFMVWTMDFIKTQKKIRGIARNFDGIPLFQNSVVYIFYGIMNIIIGTHLPVYLLWKQSRVSSESPR